MLFQRLVQQPSEQEPCLHTEELVELIPWLERLGRHELEPQRHKLEQLGSSCSWPLALANQRDSNRTSFPDGSRLELEHKPALESRLVQELAGKQALEHKLLGHKPERLEHRRACMLVLAHMRERMALDTLACRAQPCGKSQPAAGSRMSLVGSTSCSLLPLDRPSQALRLPRGRNQKLDA